MSSTASLGGSSVAALLRRARRRKSVGSRSVATGFISQPAQGRTLPQRMSGSEGTAQPDRSADAGPRLLLAASVFP